MSRFTAWQMNIIMRKETHSNCGERSASVHCNNEAAIRKCAKKIPAVLLPHSTRLIYTYLRRFLSSDSKKFSAFQTALGIIKATPVSEQTVLTWIQTASKSATLFPFSKICPILISMRFGNAHVMFNCTGFPERQFPLRRDKNKKSLIRIKKK